jgi:peptide/bleomycin uptake transporter
MEGLGTAFIDSIMTLIAFMPVLIGLSAHITELPIVGAIPNPLVVAAIVWAFAGTISLVIAGYKLPGLQFKNQRVEAAYRKELVYGEDHADRAAPPTARQLFSNVQRNYFRIYFNVQISAWINDWQGSFFNLLQQALSKPGSVRPEEFYGQVIVLFAVLMPNIAVLVLLDFFTSHYVFRWRKAMNALYMHYWPTIRTVEGAAQRVQEDTMRFASIVENLGTSFFSSLITLVVFLPILWNLSVHITHLPYLGNVPGSLVWVALLAAAFGTVMLGVVGIRLPGLNFDNQKVEAAYRKELVYGEDHADRAAPPTARQLFSNVQRNYFRIYFNYTYFNLARYLYLNLVGYVPLLAMAPSILAGAITLGVYQQVQNAFDQVSSSFQFFARAWSTIVELLSIRKRLVLFESHIPYEAANVVEPPLPAPEAGY